MALVDSVFIMKKYGEFNYDEIEDCKNVIQALNIDNSTLVMMPCRDIGVFCSYLPSYMENTNIMEQLIYINNSVYVSGVEKRSKKVTIEVFDFDKCYVLLKKITNLKNNMEKYMMIVYNPKGQGQKNMNK